MVMVMIAVTGSGVCCYSQRFLASVGTLCMCIILIIISRRFFLFSGFVESLFFFAVLGILARAFYFFLFFFL